MSQTDAIAQADLPEFYTTEEAAALLKVHEDTIRKAIADGTLPHIKLGPKTFRIPRKGLNALWLSADEEAE